MKSRWGRGKSREDAPAEGELEVAAPALEPERCRVRRAELSAPGTRRQ